jgi:hypothetical protein
VRCGAKALSMRRCLMRGQISAFGDGRGGEIIERYPSVQELGRFGRNKHCRKAGCGKRGGE